MGGKLQLDERSRTPEQVPDQFTSLLGLGEIVFLVWLETIRDFLFRDDVPKAMRKLSGASDCTRNNS